jgi:hypothetical protein
MALFAGIFIKSAYFTLKTAKKRLKRAKKREKTL